MEGASGRAPAAACHRHRPRALCHVPQRGRRGRARRVRHAARDGECRLTEIVAVDIGGTHARFAIAEIENGRVARLDEEITLKTAEHASLQTAWEDFGRRLGRPLPPAASIAIAGPVQGELLKLTNNPWVIRPAL